MIKPYYENDHGLLYHGSALDILSQLPEQSVNCCVTSPPYFGLRDYGVDGQLGLESTPEEYVEKMVKIFREVKRVLKADGTVWLNLGVSYARQGGDKTGLPRHWDGRKSDPMSYNSTHINNINGFSGGKNSNRSPLLQRVPACDIDGKVSQDFQGDGHACHGSYDEPQDETQNHHENTFHIGQSALQGEQQICKKDHDILHSDSGQEPLCASPPGAQGSTIEQFFHQHLDASALEAKASVSPKVNQTFFSDAQGFSGNSVCTSGTSQMSPPLVVRTVGKESFFSACHSPDCKGIGKCGLCWCSLAIPSLNVKPKDELNIPHLVAMALQADGWILRQTIIWHKPNPMPESVTDRCTKAHEYIFLLSKSQKYFYDHESIKEEATWKETRPSGMERNGEAYRDKVKHSNKDYGGGGTSFQGHRGNYKANGDLINPDGKRNKRSVWTVTTKPFKEAHFAVFPPKLIEPCILAGCPKGGTVLDPFFGSGTTGLVAYNFDRKFIGIELNAEYCAMSSRRIEQETKQLKLFN